MDIKDKEKAAPLLLAKLLNEADEQERVYVCSFHTKQLETFRNLSACSTSATPKEVKVFLLNLLMIKHQSLVALQVPKCGYRKNSYSQNY